MKGVQVVGARRITSKPVWIAAVSGLIFFYLLGVRLDLFREKPGFLPVNVENLSGNETWMNIYQKERKIGYSHRRFVPEDSGYNLLDTTFMRLNTMGMIQDLHMRTKATLNPDLSLSTFDFTLRSNLFDFKVRGEIREKTLFVMVGSQKTKIPVEEGLYLTGGILDAVRESGLEPGKSRTFSVFDPTTLGRRPVRVTVEGEEMLHVMGRDQKTRKLSINFMGTSQTAWIGEDGSVVQERGIMGITLKRVTQQEAFDELALSPSRDLTRLVSVAANVPIGQPEVLSMLQIHITGIDDPLFLDGGRQHLKADVLTISREPVPDPPDIQADDFRKFIVPTPFIESDHPEILQQVAGIVSPEDTPRKKVEKITAWIYKNIEKRPVLSIPSALQTLETRMGDCNEHAVLMAAMARAAGIPAQIEAGMVYLRGQFYYHAWNVLHLGRWVTVDALMNQIPADVTHIRFVRGEPSKQIDLMGVIGTVKLKILDKS